MENSPVWSTFSVNILHLQLVSIPVSTVRFVFVALRMVLHLTVLELDTRCSFRFYSEIRFCSITHGFTFNGFRVGHTVQFNKYVQALVVQYRIGRTDALPLPKCMLAYFFFALLLSFTSQRAPQKISITVNHQSYYDSNSFLIMYSLCTINVTQNEALEYARELLNC